VSVIPELLLAPVLVAISILAGRRAGQRVSGLVSSFPAVVGPVLLIAAQEHGSSFTARTANGILFGLVTLAGFTVAYARTLGRAHWSLSLACGWVVAGALAVPLRWLAGDLGQPAGLLVAMISLSVAHAALPAATASFRRDPPGTGGRHEIVLQMALTVTLVGFLAAAAAQLGPTIGGILAGLPVLASVLATRTHRRDGGDAVVALLRGMLAGMPAFVGFVALVGLLIAPLGTALAFGLAIIVAVVLQFAALDGRIPARA
jgi:hypothetical protein